MCLVVELPVVDPMKITLRPLAMSDLDAIMEWINDPEVTRNFAGLSKEITREQEEAYLERVLADSNERLWAVVDPQGRYLGNAGIHKIYWPARNGRLGVVLGGRGARGRGLGTEVVRLLCRKGFGELGLHKLWLMHYATNDRMAHIAQKLGFQQEGRLRDEYFHQGAFHDMVRWSLLEDEFPDER